MQSMSEDDVAYTALLTQLLSDSSSTRNARVHSWIEHQYDFALSEQNNTLRGDALPTDSRPPSPSPSSSLGAHRTFSIDRPDSPLLPRSSADGPSSPRSEACPSYDALFFPQSDALSEDDQLEERERERALKFLVQEMAHWKTVHSVPSTPHRNDKPLPVPPPSPTTSISQSISSRALRSRSSSMRISRLPSFTSTLSSDQTQPQDIFAPPLPVSVIVHGETHHDLVLRHENPYPDGYPLAKKDVYSHHDQDVRLLQPQDDKDSAFPSPTFSNFSCTFSRETCITTPCGSFPASPASATFVTAYIPENIALPASPQTEQTFFSETVSVSAEGDGITCPLSPSHMVPPTAYSVALSPVPSSPSSAAVQPSFCEYLLFAPATDGDDVSAQAQRLRAALTGIQSESRWSIATTASFAPSAAEPVKSGSFLSPRTPSKDKKSQTRSKDAKTPKQRRFISLFSRFSPGRNDSSTATMTSIGSTSDKYEDYESDRDDMREKSKLIKSLNKKSSLASLRMSFSLSRASFSGTRPALASPTEEIPPLPMSPTRASMAGGEPPSSAPTEPMPMTLPVTKSSIPRVSSRANLLEAALPPIPGSASTVTTFRNPSQVSLVYTTPSPATSSKVSLLPSPTISTFPSNSMGQYNNASTSRISLLPPPSKRVSFQSSGIAVDSSTDEHVSIHPLDSSSLSMNLSAKSTTPSRTKSIFRLTSKPKTPKVRTNAVPVPVQKKLASSGSYSQPPSNSSSSNTVTMATSDMPSPMKFSPPSKLASVLAGQMPAPPRQPNSSRATITNILVSPLPKSKLPTSHSKITSPSSKVPRSATVMTGLRVPVYPADGNAKLGLTESGTPTGTSKLPMPALSHTQRPAKVGTVQGLWRK
ncbi:hypothetical protein V8B97DRAFT_1865571 [Scleroderma yunnanense]